MGIFGKLLGGGSEMKRPLSAREALPLAEEALQSWSPVKASSAHLCCVYTSVEEANREILKDGRCRAWHFDFCLPNAQMFYLVRVVDGKAKGKERTFLKRPVEYIYALYGSDDKEGQFAEPCLLPSDWADTPAVAEAALGVLGREVSDAALLDDYGIFCICLTAGYLRYLHPQAKPKLLQTPAPSDLCYAAMVSHVDIDTHDSFMVYVNAATGELVHAERFRFPALFNYGVSADW